MPRVTSDPDDGAMASYAAALQAAVASAIHPWVGALIEARAPQLRARATAVADEVAADALPRLRSLLESDLDDQRTTPLQVLRGSTGPVTALLAAADVPRPHRDAQAQRIDPDDVYDLGPASFADLGEAVGDAGLTWGAAKAHVHLARRRAAAERADGPSAS
jgi:hypothetical protein